MGGVGAPGTEKREAQPPRQRQWQELLDTVSAAPGRPEQGTAGCWPARLRGGGQVSRARRAAETRALLGPELLLSTALGTAGKVPAGRAWDSRQR